MYRLIFSIFRSWRQNWQLKFATNYDGGTITFVHVYNVPSGYHVSGKSSEEFWGDTGGDAKKHYQQFISKIDLKGVKVRDAYKLDEGDNIPKSIYNFAVKEQASGIVMGSKGRTTIASILMGSIAEKIIKLNSLFPLIIAKSRKDAMDIFDVIGQ